MSEVQFEMKVVKFCKTSFEVQIAESVIIQQEKNNHHILNSKAEYNGCSLPRLSQNWETKKFNNLNKNLRLKSKNKKR